MGEIREPLPAYIEVYKAGIDRTLLRENLHRTPEERLRNMMELQRAAEELRRAGKKTSGHDAAA